jgi:hypothetical protein
MEEIDRRRLADPTLSYGDAFVAVGRDRPDLAALYLVESRGAKPLPGSDTRVVSGRVWQEVDAVFARIPPAKRMGIIHPLVCRHWLSRWQPVYYLDEHHSVIGSGGDRLLGAHFDITDRRPRYTRAPLLRLAINLEFATADVITTIEAILRCRPPATRRRARYTAKDIAAIIRWYYRRRSGVPLKVLAAEEATQPRTRRTAARPHTAAAVRQAAKRIQAGLRWFERQFPRSAIRSPVAQEPPF